VLVPMKHTSGRSSVIASWLAIAAGMLLIMPSMAFAYVGPGAGITMIGTLIGIVVVIFGAIGAILYWPVRAMLRKKKNAAAASDNSGSDGGAAS
jgi:uncharacterized membrane protein HdeD (DUF308 family)